jgi:hypothetical protein
MVFGFFIVAYVILVAANFDAGVGLGVGIDFVFASVLYSETCRT